jgi:predicted amidohydrolase
LLTVAGSFHFRHGDDEDRWSNLCTVLDHTGRTLWRQQKRIPFPFQGPVPEWLRGCPPGLGPDESYHEDIEPGRSVVLARSPLGWLAVAICSDLVPFSTGEVSRLSRLPLDWVLIPSMSTTTEQFLEVARELARAGKIVCFANAVQAREREGEGDRPPEFLDQQFWRSDLAAFVQSPVSHAFGLWFDRPDPPAGARYKGASIAIPEEGVWEGLTIDLLDVLDAYLTP